MAKPAAQGLENIVQEAPKKQFSIDELEEKYVYAPGRYVDGFVGSFVRSAATSYNIGMALPMVVANPLLGIPYAAIMALTAYSTSNVLEKVGSKVVNFGYNIVRHPVSTLTGMGKTALGFIPGIGWFSRLGSFVSSKVTGQTSRSANKPSGIIGFFLGAENENKLGRTLGSIIGGGLALNYFAPGTFDSVAGKVAEYISPKIASVKDGVTLATEKVSGLAGAVYDAGKNYYVSNLQNAY